MPAEVVRDPAWHETMLGLELTCGPNPTLSDAFDPAEVSVVQYLRPHGRRRMMRCNVGAADAQLARDAELVLSAETAGDSVILYGRRRSDPAYAELVLLAHNGPGPDEPSRVLQRLIHALAGATT